MAVKTGADARVDISGTGLALTALELVPDLNGDQYSVASADVAKRFWDPNSPLTVEVSTNRGAGTPTWTTEPGNPQVRYCNGQVTYSLPTGTAVVGAAMTGTVNGTNKVFTTPNAPVAQSPAPVVKDNGSAAAGTWNYTTGTFTFTTAPVSGHTITCDYTPIKAVRVTGQYLPVSTWAEAKDWSITGDGDMVNTTPLGSDWKRQQSSQKSGSTKLTVFFQDDTFWKLLRDGALAVLVLYADKTAGSRYETYAYLKTQGLKVAADGGAVEEDLPFENTGQMVYCAS